jgi:predicted ester cyclase
MSAEANMEVVQEWVEQIWNAGNLELLAHFHPPVFDNHGARSTIEEMKQWHHRNRVTFPDIRYTIDDLFAVDDRVALRWSATATHRGALWGTIPPTGKIIKWNGIHLLRLANHQIVEVWAVQNSLAQLQQMRVTLQPVLVDAAPA